MKTLILASLSLPFLFCQYAFAQQIVIHRTPEAVFFGLTPDTPRNEYVLYIVEEFNESTALTCADCGNNPPIPIVCKKKQIGLERLYHGEDRTSITSRYWSVNPDLDLLKDTNWSAIQLYDDYGMPRTSRYGLASPSLDFFRDTIGLEAQYYDDYGMPRTSRYGLAGSDLDLFINPKHAVQVKPVFRTTAIANVAVDYASAPWSQLPSADVMDPSNLHGVWHRSFTELTNRERYKFIDSLGFESIHDLTENETIMPLNKLAIILSARRLCADCANNPVLPDPCEEND